MEMAYAPFAEVDSRTRYVPTATSAHTWIAAFNEHGITGGVKVRCSAQCGTYNGAFTNLKSEKHTYTATHQHAHTSTSRVSVAILAFPHWERVTCSFVAKFWRERCLPGELGG
jgi:hypothetical protein